MEIDRQHEQMRKRLLAVEEQIKEIDDRIRYLESDRDTLEKYAREEFGLAAPGEDVYILED